MKRFTDKIVLITGGGTGIGQTTALAFAREGAVVVLAGRSAMAGEQTVSLIKERGGEAHYIQTDVTNEEQVASLLHQIMTRYDRLDIAFNNAGVLGKPGPLTELDEQDWDTVFNVNVKGTWLSMKYELQHMLKRKIGAIINMSSNIGARIANPVVAPYTAAKAAVLGLTQAAALEYIKSGIRINAVSPGPVTAPMSLQGTETEAERAQRVAALLPIGRIGLAEEVSDAVLWLASPQSSLVVGHDIILDGGVSLQ